MSTGGEAPLPIRATARLPKYAPVGRLLFPYESFLSRKARKERIVFKTSRTSSAPPRLRVRFLFYIRFDHAHGFTPVARLSVDGDANIDGLVSNILNYQFVQLSFLGL